MTSRTSGATRAQFINAIVEEWFDEAMDDLALLAALRALKRAEGKKARRYSRGNSISLPSSYVIPPMGGTFTFPNDSGTLSIQGDSGESASDMA